MRLFYNGRCIRPMSECKTIESKSKGVLIAKYKFDCSKDDLFPEFNEGFEYIFVDEQVDDRDVMSINRETVTVMTYDAIPDEYGVLTTEYEVETPVLINAGDIITRSIYSNDLPTKVSFEDCEGLLEVNYLNTSELTTLRKAFKNCYNVTSINATDWDTSKVKNMSDMFMCCYSLTSVGDLSNWQVGNVIYMGSMFDSCESLISLNVSNWDTSNVIDMSWLFEQCYSLETIIGLDTWNVSNVTNMEGIFAEDYELTTLNINNWSLNSELYTNDYMFYDNFGLDTIMMNNSDSDSVNRIIYELPTRTSDTTGTLNITGVDDISKVDIETAEAKFWSVKTSMLIAKYTANASGVVPTFNEGYQYTVNETNSNGIYTVELYSDTDFTSCNFYGKANLLTVEYLRVTKNVTNMYQMFYDCIRLTSIDLSKWDTSKVTNTSYMFYQCYNLASIGDVSNLDTSKVTTMESMFESCENLTTVNSSNWDVSNVKNMSYMFHFCSKLKRLDASNWDVSNVTDMSYMFYCCDSLSELDFSRWDVSNVINMELLFCNCCSFSQNTIDGLRNWDVGNVGYMSAMIDCLCINDVTTIDLSDWDVSNVIDMSYMLEYNTELKYLNLNNWILNEKVDTTELFLKSNNLEKVSIMNSNAFTINKIIAELPTRTNNSIGTLDISGVDDISQVNITTAQSKYWNVVGKQLVAKYKFNKPALAIDMDSIMYQIPEPITFNNSGFIDTGIQLLKNDSDWTMFLDCIPNINNKSQAVIHCVDENGSYPGISFSFENKGKINFYDGTSSTELGYGQYLNKNIKIVIVKKDNNIIVYHNYSSSILYQPDYPIIIPYTFKSANTTLSIGGGHIGTSAIHTFSGVINNFVIYNKALEEQECESIMSDNPLPIFNNNFNYTIEDKYLDADDENIVTRSIYADTDFTSCSFEGETGLSTVEYLKVTNKVTTMDSMFYNCYLMTSVNANGWDTSNVTSMSSTFGYCCHLEEIIGIENWNTSSLEDLTDTFLCCCVGLTSVNLSGWDTSNVTSMYDTFQYCCNLEEIIGIGNWNTSSLEDTTYMFMCCESLTTLNLSGWDTSNVYLPDEMFSDCTYLEELDISNWDLSNADPYWLSYMFYLSELDSDTEYYDPDFKPYLKTIRCNNANTISLIAPYLPDRSTCEEAGIIFTDNVSEVNTEELIDKHWNVI